MNLKPYFDETTCKAISGSAEEIISTIANRYIRENPASSLSYRAYTEDRFRRDRSGCYAVDFNDIFPNADEGEYAYAYAQYKVTKEMEVSFYFGSRNLTEIFVNGKRIIKTNVSDEFLEEDRLISVPSQKGYNSVFVKCRKNALGFGFHFGARNHKGNPVEFYKAFVENAEELGWNYCGCFKHDIYHQPLCGNPSIEEFWQPRPYDPQMSNSLECSQMYAVSTLVAGEESAVTIHIEAEAELEVYIDGKFLGEGKGRLCTTIKLTKGIHAISVRMMNRVSNSNFMVRIEGAELRLPDCVKNVKGEWLYLMSADEEAKEGFDKYQIYNDIKPGNKTFFMCGKDTWLRPVLETEQFGRLNYPNGVVLYGLLETGEWLRDSKILEYAHDHLRTCYASLELALWDKKRFGWACVDHRLMDVTLLDDCGSFSAMVLEDYIKYHKDEKILSYAEFVADYILHKQERLENGMFYREAAGTYQQMTIWADDIYMSTPFMIRYANIKEDPLILDDAVNQFLRYKEKLYMDEYQLLGHVYNLKYQKNSRIPWGRGNGWVLFSLTELLAVLPKEHKHYNDIKNFFCQLAEGFLKCVDENGMLHQILWDRESFEEASGTAMCAAAYARGIRMGILPAERYKESSERSVEALKKYCIDEEGNIYGVCHGSAYSFREEYYKYDLRCVTNDTHGIGIVLIALIEVERNHAL